MLEETVYPQARKKLLLGKTRITRRTCPLDIRSRQNRLLSGGLRWQVTVWQNEIRRLLR
jgi:hypothetical protein